MSITVLIPAALAAVLAVLSAIHVFWAAGGRLGTGGAVPEVSGRPAFTPSPALTLLVAAALALAALVALSRGQLLWPSLSGSFVHWAAVGLGAVFLLRAVGEFRLVGFFKRVRGTSFARWDDWLFSPLCLLIALGFFFVATL